MVREAGFSAGNQLSQIPVCCANSSGFVCWKTCLFSDLAWLCRSKKAGLWQTTTRLKCDDGNLCETGVPGLTMVVTSHFHQCYYFHAFLVRELGVSSAGWTWSKHIATVLDLKKLTETHCKKPSSIYDGVTNDKMYFVLQPDQVIHWSGK